MPVIILLKRSRRALCLGLVTTFFGAASGQSLYLLAGPTEVKPQTSVLLFRAKNTAPGVDLVRTIIDPMQYYACSIVLDPGERMAAITLENKTEATVTSFDMDHPTALQTAKVIYGAAPGTARNCLKGFLARSPDGRLLQVVSLGPEWPSSGSQPQGRVDASSFSLAGVQIRPPLAAPQTEQVPWSYEARVETSRGGTGIGKEGLFEVNVKGDGLLSVVSGGPAELPYSMDPKTWKLVARHPEGAFWLEVNNAQWLSLLRAHSTEPTPNGVGGSFHDVLDKISGQWQTLQVPGSESVLKNFGDWFGALVIEGNTTRESPGRASRLRINPNHGGDDPPVDIALERERQYSPGKLYLINLRTQKSYTIQTGEGDSEVLLIDSGVVYYRVNDSIFSAPIGPEKVGTPVLIATDPHIPDVHWAFLGPPVQDATKVP